MSGKEDVQESMGDAPLVSRTEIAAQVAELEETVHTINTLLASLAARMMRTVDELKDEVNRRVAFGDLEPIRKDLEKIRDRIDEVVDEAGFGEALDVAKVPPSILEAAYQATLDDVVGALRNKLGAHDAELHIHRALEQVRQKTSGSELFLFRPPRLNAGVAKALERGLASARQVQMTYEELMRHLLEPIHTHRPRNFRALIKIKSQEYAVDKALTLAKTWEQAGPRIQQLGERITLLEDQVKGALGDVQDFAAQLQETLAGTATRESLEALGMRLVALEGRVNHLSPSAGSAPPPEAAPSVEGGLEQRVLAVLSAEPLNMAALRNALGMSEGELREVLADLERRGLISSSVRGKTTVYRRKEEHNNA